MQSFALTLHDHTYYDVVVDAPDQETALAIVEEHWLRGDLPQSHGYTVILEGDDELAEVANW